MSDYYTSTCFEIGNVSPIEAAWLKGTLNILDGVIDGDSPEDCDEEAQALWAEVKECEYLALPYTLYDVRTRVVTVCGESISIDVLNIVLKAFLKRWNRTDTVEYTWSHRSDNCEEVGEFYGGTESVCAVETPRTRDDIINEIVGLFKGEFGDNLSASVTSGTGQCLKYAGGVLSTGCAPYAWLGPSETSKYAPQVLELWAALVEKRKRRVATLQAEEPVLQETLRALCAKKAGE